MKECRRCREAIEAALPKRAFAAHVRAHLSRCASCRAFYAERSALTALLRELPRVEAPKDFELRLRAGLVARPRTPPPRLFDPATVLASLAILSVATALLLHVRWAAGEQTVATRQIEEQRAPILFEDPVALIRTTETRVAKHKRQSVRAKATSRRPEIVAEDFAVKIAPAVETMDEPLVAHALETKLLNKAGEVQIVRIEPVSFGDEAALKIVSAEPRTEQ